MPKIVFCILIALKKPRFSDTLNSILMEVATMANILVDSIDDAKRAISLLEKKLPNYRQPHLT